MINYLYIYPDGMLAQSSQPPTEMDHDSIDQGELQVVQVECTDPYCEIAGIGDIQQVQNAVRDSDGYTIPLDDYCEEEE